jgi:hypothetical protein
MTINPTEGRLLPRAVLGEDEEQEEEEDVVDSLPPRPPIEDNDDRADRSLVVVIESGVVPPPRDEDLGSLPRKTVEMLAVRVAVSSSVSAVLVVPAPLQKKSQNRGVLGELGRAAPNQPKCQ